ncbi:MAG: M4 family metallopeptidase [Candidatus Woesebacteria bacterium]|jgi:Zn-dependent metalloprotease
MQNIDNNETPNVIKNLQQNDPELKARFDTKLETVAHIRGNIFGSAGAKAISSRATISATESKVKDFVRENRELFGEIDASNLEAIHESTDPDGSKNIVFQQYHGRARVIGGSVRFKIKPSNEPDTISNRLFDDITDLPKRAAKSAENAVIKAEKATGCKAQSEKTELVVFRKGSKPHLAWEVELVGPMNEKPSSRSKHSMLAGNSDLPEDWIVYIDAINGEELLKYNQIQTAGATTGKGQGYYSDYEDLNTWFNDTTYQLRDTTQKASGGPEIITRDDNGTYSSSAPISEDSNNVWDNTINDPRHTSQGPEVDAHKYALKTYMHFKDKHNHIGFDGSGSDFDTTVHLGVNYSNAFWHPYYKKVFLGDGDRQKFDYFSEDAIVSHEFTHGYTQFTCGLNYYGEAGALNEAFSDIFGAAFVNNTWLCGVNCWLQNETAPAVRNMIDPTCGGKWSVSDPINSVMNGWQPSHYSVRYEGTWDNAGVHINSGIINNLFYLLTEGGTHTVSNQTVQGIGQTASENMLWRCMTVNLVGKPNATFLDFREAMLDACQDLYPEDLFKLMQVKNAFNAVGIGPDVYIRDNLTDTGVEPYIGEKPWRSPDIINRNYPSPDPNTDFGDFTKYYTQLVNYNADNYLYVRLQNRGACSGDANIKVYIVPTTTMGMPSTWTCIGSMFTANIPAGGKRICGPLIFEKSNIPPVPSGFHYCFIAVATDPLDPAPDINLINTTGEFRQFVVKVNNIAWRNTTVVYGPDIESCPPLQGFIGANPNEDPQNYSIRIDATNFIPGAAIKVSGPSRFLDVAEKQHMTSRVDDPDVPDGISSYGLNTVPDDADDELPGNGFNDIITNEYFILRVDYALPEATVIDKEYWLTVTQYLDGQRIGSFSLYLQPDNPSILRRVTMVKKDDDGDIIALYNPDETWWQEVTKAQAISDIESGRRTYWTAVQDGIRKDVIVVNDSRVAGGKYLRSSPDTQTPNNLDELPIKN